ncbi:MAG: GYD domain-containing protein, partial [Chloroflexi bacterium]|nr:GYD domain-containing protein [Chloroflexota bacterium]
MATYIQLLTLTPEGRVKALEDPQIVLRAQESITIQGTQCLGLYGVLGDYDFVNIVEASDNEAIARFSLLLGVRAGVHVVTLPAISIARLGGTTLQEAPLVPTEITLTPPED